MPAYTYKILLYITLRVCRFYCVADRGPASGAGAFAALQAGGREARPQPQLLLWTGRLQQQDQGGGAGARGQEAQAGTDEMHKYFNVQLSKHCSFLVFRNSFCSALSDSFCLIAKVSTVNISSAFENDLLMNN